MPPHHILVGLLAEVVTLIKAFHAIGVNDVDGTPPDQLLGCQPAAGIVVGTNVGDRRPQVTVN